MKETLTITLPPELKTIVDNFVQAEGISLKNQPVYEQILQLAFRDVPNAKSLQEIGNVKPMKGATNRYRIRLGEYRLGIALVHPTF